MVEDGHPNPEIYLNSWFLGERIWLAHFGSSDYLWPYQLRLESQGVVQPSLLGSIPGVGRVGTVPVEEGLWTSQTSPPPSVWYKNFWRLTTFPLSDLMVVRLCFWPFSPQYPPPSLLTSISHWQPQSRNWVKCFLGTHHWDLATSEGLLPRYEHASFVPSCTPHSIWVFGGADQSGNRNCLQVLNPGK